MLRQPLRDTFSPNARAGLKMGANRGEHVLKKEFPLFLDVQENQVVMSNNNSRKKQTPPNSKKHRAKVILGRMLDRFQKRSNGSRSSSPSSTTSSSSTSSSTSTKMEVLIYATPREHEETQTAVHTETPPGLDASFVVSVQSFNEAHLPQHAEEDDRNVLEVKEGKAATLLQSTFRGYYQRYEFRMMVLRHKLQKIQANKERQLKKLAERTKSHKRHAKSLMEFQNPHEKTVKQLQRVTRLIPYLFREAQAKLRENVQIASSSHHLVQLEESHKSLQRLAHSYLESLEDLPGIWEALSTQWMAPKKLRPKRSFGPDGKFVARVNVRDTPDDDLSLDSAKEHANFVNLFVQAYASEIYSTDEEVDQAVDQFQEEIGRTVWN